MTHLTRGSIIFFLLVILLGGCAAASSTSTLSTLSLPPTVAITATLEKSQIPQEASTLPAAMEYNLGENYDHPMDASGSTVGSVRCRFA